MQQISAEIRAYFSAMGKKGGSIRGASKARTREQAQRAVNARWDRYRERVASGGLSDGQGLQVGAQSATDSTSAESAPSASAI